MSAELTLKQQAMLDFIKRYAVSHGFPPTLREIGGHFQISAPSVLAHLRALEKKGSIRREPFKPRCMEILKAA